VPEEARHADAMLALTGVRPYVMSVTVLRANRKDFATSIQSPTRAWRWRIAARTRCCSSAFRSDAFCSLRATVMVEPLATTLVEPRAPIEDRSMILAPTGL
jgi:hypothetical protein